MLKNRPLDIAVLSLDEHTENWLTSSPVMKEVMLTLQIEHFILGKKKKVD